MNAHPHDEGTIKFVLFSGGPSSLVIAALLAISLDLFGSPDPNLYGPFKFFL
jgi:hypothetical protein